MQKDLLNVVNVVVTMFHEKLLLLTIVEMK